MYNKVSYGSYKTQIEMENTETFLEKVKKERDAIARSLRNSCVLPNQQRKDQSLLLWHINKLVRALEIREKYYPHQGEKNDIY